MTQYRVMYYCAGGWSEFSDWTTDPDQAREEKRICEALGLQTEMRYRTVGPERVLDT